MCKQTILLSAWFLLLSAGAQAREPLPPPRGATTLQDRQELRKARRQRLLRGLLKITSADADAPSDQPGDAKTKGQANKPAAPGLLQGLLPLLTGPGGKQAAKNVQTPIEASKLNAAMAEEVLRPLANELEPVDKLQLRFDEQRTDFARDRIGLAGDIQLRSTPWKSPARLGLNVFARLESTPRRGTQAMVAFDVDLATDTVAMLNFLKQRALQKCQETARQGAMTAEEAATCQLLQATSAFASLGDVADLLPRVGEINLHGINKKITQLKARISSQDRAEPDKALIDQLAKAYQQRDNLLAFSIRSRRDRTLNVREMVITLPGGAVSYQFANLDAVEIHLTEGGLVGHIEIRIGQAGVLVYQGAKALVVEPALRRLQQRDPATIRNLRRQGRQFGKQLEELRTPPPAVRAPKPPAVENLPEPKNN